MSCVAQSFFSFPLIVLVGVGAHHSLLPISCSIVALLSHFRFYHFFHSSSPSFPIFLSVFSVIMSSSMAFITFVLCDDFGKSAKDRSQKIDRDVVLYETLDGSPKILVSTAIFGTGVTYPDEF